MTDYNQALAYLHSFQRFGWIFGRLDRITALLEALGNPHKALSFIHIAGTNGKGTTAALCANILQVAGYRCGMFISPYVLQFEERFQINGTMITQDELVTLVAQIKPAIEQVYRKNITITEFEVITVLGFLYFAQKKCDIVCLETGLGGGDDATNVIDAPRCSIITSISMDHTSILGNTIAEIARHKAGIIKPASPVICYAHQHPDALAVLQARCVAQNSLFIQPNLDNCTILHTDCTGADFRYRGDLFHLLLPGTHQVINALSAIEAMQVLIGQGYHITKKHLAKGIVQTTFPARFQILRKQPLVIADIAHNIESMQGLCTTLQCIPGEKIFLLGMLAEKDLHGVLSLIKEQATQIICITPHNPRAISGQNLCTIAQQYAPAIFSDDYRIAYRKALLLANASTSGAVASSRPTGTVVICGSFFVMQEMLTIVAEEETFSPPPYAE